MITIDKAVLEECIDHLYEAEHQISVVLRDYSHPALPHISEVIYHLEQTLEEFDYLLDEMAEYYGEE